MIVRASIRNTQKSVKLDLSADVGQSSPAITQIILDKNLSKMNVRFVLVSITLILICLECICQASIFSIVGCTLGRKING